MFRITNISIIFFATLISFPALSQTEFDDIIERSDPDFFENQLNRPPDLNDDFEVKFKREETEKLSQKIKIKDINLIGAEFLNEKDEFILELNDNVLNEELSLKELKETIDEIASRYSTNIQPITPSITRLDMAETFIDRVATIQLNTEGTLDNEGKFLVNKIEFFGNTAISSAEINEILNTFELRKTTYDDFVRLAVNEIEDLYFESDYLSTRIGVDTIDFTKGIIKLEIFEDEFVETEECKKGVCIQGNKRVNDSYIRSRVLRGIGKPINWKKLEDNLKVLSSASFIKSAEGIVQPRRIGERTFNVLVEEGKKNNKASVQIKNDSGPAVAPENGQLDLSFKNVSGMGDEIYSRYNVGINFGDFDRAHLHDVRLGYRVPITPEDGTLDIQGRFRRSKLMSGQGSERQTYDLKFNQPFYKTSTKQIGIGASFQYRQSDGFDNSGSTSTNKASILNVSQFYKNKEKSGDWDALSQLSFGLPILDATTGNSERDNEFFKWYGEVSRIQKFSDGINLSMKVGLQLSAEPLPGLAQFGFGGLGFNSLRGYRRFLRGGDNGYRISLESTLPLVRKSPKSSKEKSTIFAIKPFFEFGDVWNHPNNSSTGSTQDFLAGTGAGLVYTPISDLKGLNVGLFLSVPLIDIDDKGDSLQDDGIYFLIKYDRNF